MSDPLVEFESPQGPGGLQLSKPFATPQGTQVRAVATSGGSILVTPTAAGVVQWDSIVVLGLDLMSTTQKSVGIIGDIVGRIVDTIEDILTDGGGGGGGGGGQKCETVTTVEVGAGGKILRVITKTSCSPV
ncbi:MAG: hypothetical protein ACRDJH_17455 [Thermomicrobiales bacterium]